MSLQTTKQNLRTCLSSFVNLFRQLQRDGKFEWDKNDPDCINFVSSASNLRAYIFRIDPMKPWDIQKIAGKIIPGKQQSFLTNRLELKNE